MRFFRWSLIIAGSLLLARTSWLVTMYWGEMSEQSKSRACILIGTSLCISAFGVWLVYRQRRSHA